MVNPIEKVRRENERLRNQLKSREEIIKLGRERKMLLKEQGRLIRQKKFGGVIRAGKIAGRTGKAVGKATGKVAGKIGITLGRGLIHIGRNIQENERRERLALIRQSQKRKPKAKSKAKSTRRKSRRRGR